MLDNLNDAQRMQVAMLRLLDTLKKKGILTDAEATDVKRDMLSSDEFEFLERMKAQRIPPETKG